MKRDLIPVAVPPRGAGGGGGGKGGGGSQRAPQEAPDSLISTQYARVLCVLCEGEIDSIVNGAQGIFLDDTPLANPDGSWNFTGAGVEWRTGRAWQAPIPGFSAAESEQNVGVEVRNAAPVVRTITNPNMSSVRVTLGFPQMTFTDNETGDLLGTSVVIRIEIQADGAGFHEIITDTIEGKSTSRYQRSYRIRLARFGGAGPQYDIRVSRLTPDDQGAQVANTVQWETFTEIVDSELIYPYSALAGVQVDAATFRSIPNVSFDTRMTCVAVPSNYDPETRQYHGVWDGTFRQAWTDNPAWIFYDLAVTRRYGLGEYLNPTLLDRWTLYDLGMYCDGMVPDGFGGLEPRYTCNVYIQEREEAIRVLQQFASIFNGMIFWSGGALTVSADRPADPVMTFAPANVIDGEFGYVGTPLLQRHTCALVTWNNPNHKFEQEIEYVEDAESIALYGLREAEILAFGCTSRGQAHRVGRWYLLTEQFLSETISFRTGINGAFIRPGDVFTTTDPTRAGVRNGGRVLGGDTVTVHLDAAVTLMAGIGYRLSVMLPDGRLETRDVAVALVGETNVLQVAAPFSLPVSRMGMWALSGSNVQTELWRCLSVAEDDDGNLQINGVMYNESKFAAIEHGLNLELPDTSIINPFHVGPCTELNLTESLFQISPVVVGARVTFSWLAPIGGVRFIVSYQMEHGSPVTVETNMPSIDVQPTQEGVWFFTVWAVNSLGIESVPASIRRELVALNRPPQDVADFQLDVYDDGAQLRWRPATDLDVIVGGQMIVRYSSRMTTEVRWEEASEIQRFAGGSSNGFVPLMKGAYLAKFMNSSGRISQNPTYVISTTGPLRDYNVVAEMPQQPDFEGEHVNTYSAYGVLYIARDGDGFAVSTSAAYYFAPAVLDMGKVYTVRCEARLEGAVFNLFDDVDKWPDFDLRPDVDGDQVDEGGGMVLAQMTNVDPAIAEDEDWSPWARLVVADLTFRAVRFCLVMNVPDTTIGMGIYELSASVDVPDRIESQNNVQIDAASTYLRFAVPFKDTPAISIIAQGLQTGDRWDIYDQSPGGFRIRFYNAAGTPVAKTCDWIARGYGYEHTELEGVGYADLVRGAVSPARRVINRLTMEQ